jgi:hypothetical protein
MIIDLQELEAERIFFWTVVYSDVYMDYPMLNDKWTEYMFIGNLSFDNFWEIFNEFKIFLNLDIPEEVIELFLAHKIWRYKIANKDLLLMDRQIKKYLIEGAHIKWLSSELN